ncbi:MAG: hypothetical protein E6I81_14575 [Chloroflexi bacterium]|nr:MAG: hypothetical protein E6I81_14575 [Chloroflexota bacterium]
MPTPPPIPPKIVLALALALALAGCQPGSNPRAVPSVPQIGGDLKCSQGDHGYEDPQAGWGFCYPAGWRYVERSQASQSPPGLDLTFDITDATCASPAAGGAPQCSADAGLFGFMIISTYERGSSADLTSWIDSNLPHPPSSDTISWGNSVQAFRLADGRRIALTPHHVVILELHASPLDLETQMSSRLATWKFSY